MPSNLTGVPTPRRPAPAGSPKRPGRRRHRSLLSPAGALLRRLTPEDCQVLGIYLVTRISVWVLAFCARWVFPGDPEAKTAADVLSPFEQWDWHHYLHIAEQGYFPDAAELPPDSERNRVAFFPGFPLLLRAVHAVVPYWTAAGLLISFVAGAVAVLALARIAQRHLPRQDAGRHTVLLMLVSPCAVFLAVGYTEALFLALALPAWLAAQRHAWATASLLAALATAVRISGLFLAAAMAVLFVLSVRARGDWRKLPWIAVPLVPVALYFSYLRTHTGDWMAWKHAQERGWYRDFHAPWTTWSHTWDAAFDGIYGTGYGFMSQAELVAMVTGLVLLGVLLWRKSWPEATYTALSLWALGTSYWYMSVPRATLLWWPLWITLAAVLMPRPRLRVLYLCLACPLAVVFALAFLTGRWAG
ncbi:mannosyltransferase family protein [Streptomyces sp. NPDC057101]|uniref:mannosyltransferase family protein n=1 Tax=Streptomyces sp. NPDC057101 TaxID=3346020 RepID=UPI00363CB841